MSTNGLLFNDVPNLPVSFVPSTCPAILLNTNSLVESFIVFKKYPTTLQIKIKETNLVAKINKDNKIFFIGTNGKLSEKKISEKELPFIFGKPNIQEFLLSLVLH